MKKIRSMVLVSGDPLSLQLGAEDLFQNLKNEIETFGLSDEISLSMVNELGRLDALPLVVVYPEALVYGPVKPEAAHRLVEQHLYQGQIVDDLQAPVRELSGSIAWLRTRQGSLPAEQRIVLRRAGLIDPESIEDYIIADGYQALGKAVTQMEPTEVIEELKASGLQGRGGAGFPVGLKWTFVAKASGSPKYVICNADESEPGTFKDRVVMEGDPHAVLEAMAISAYAVGASEGYIYIRGEYMLAYNRLKQAIQQARALGFLGEDIFGSDFNFDIHIHAGAGAYICGEETALIESIEGKRGEPRARPPYPPTNGLWGKPTLVNNVETLVNVPPIILNGAAWYRQFGTPRSPGTKTFTILGNVNVTGIVEVPMGITLRELITIYGKGIKNNLPLKLVQTGGSAGSVVPASLQDTPIDFDSWRNAGVSMGSGALLVCDDRTCVVDLARVLMNFFRFESCGKCTPCRIGTSHSYDILCDISEGRGSLDQLEVLLKNGEHMEQLSNCGLGQTASVALRDILKHFRAEVEAHIRLGVCPAGVCPMEVPQTSEIQVTP
jgi:NADP-reducing hydrogenase subunit HndC